MEGGSASQTGAFPRAEVAPGATEGPGGRASAAETRESLPEPGAVPPCGAPGSLHQRHSRRSAYLPERDVTAESCRDAGPRNQRS